MSTAVVVWGSQLSIDYHSALQAYPNAPVILIESKNICRKYKFHKQKIAFVLTAMREYADELRAKGRIVHYRRIEDSADDWLETLEQLCIQYGFKELVAMRQNDRLPQRKLEKWCAEHSIELATTPNTLFLTSTVYFNEWAESQKRLQLEKFYRWQRIRLNILIDDGKPIGGSWNYDAQNRKPLPKGHQPPLISFPELSPHRLEVGALVEKHFPDHPGELNELWLPTTRTQARHWLKDFTDHRFPEFGNYEDAMMAGETFLYHSALSALLNIGLLHPKEVVEMALAADVPLPAKEGFIRQIIGWREFVFGLYHYKSEDWKQQNFLDQHQPLPAWWWQLSDAPEPPLQDVLQRLKIYGYSHHIERLMVLGNYMLLSDYSPQDVYDWFMTMYVDAYEWVMVPNIIGMSQFADGGIDHGGFATKPYVSGSNYLQKMGRWWPTNELAKQSGWTEMYWQFLIRHEVVLQSNFRIRPLYRNIKKRIQL